MYISIFLKFFCTDSILQIQSVLYNPTRGPTSFQTFCLILVLLLLTLVLLHLLLVMAIVLLHLLLLLVVVLLLMVMFLLLAHRWALVTIVTTIPVLGQQDTADSLVTRLQLCQVGRRNLDWVASNGENNNILPRVDLVLVLHHLRPLPVILDAGALQRELFHLDRDRSPGLSLNDSNIILRLN